MIRIEITAETGAQARLEMIDLLTGAESDPNTITYEWKAPAEQIVKTDAEEVKSPVEEKPKTRTRAASPKVEATPPVVTPEPAPVTPAPTVSNDPLATPAPVVNNDPLASTPVPTPTVDPLSGAPVTTELTLAVLRDHIGKVATEKRQQVMDLIATFKNKDGQPCEATSQLMEVDYPAVMEAVNKL